MGLIMNKKILLIDVITLFLGMLAVSLLCIFKITEISPLSIVILIVSLCVVLLSEILSLKIKDVKITNAVGTFAFFIVFYTFYNLPFLGFANSFGIQNSIGTLFLFSFTSKSLLYLSSILKNKNMDFVIKSNSLSRTKNYSQYFVRYFKYFSIFLLLGGIGVAVYNLFCMNIDISLADVLSGFNNLNPQFHSDFF
jgi:hypothetical protein